jgi:hypothetical protein
LCVISPREAGSILFCAGGGVDLPGDLTHYLVCRQRHSISCSRTVSKPQQLQQSMAAGMLLNKKRVAGQGRGGGPLLLCVAGPTVQLGAAVLHPLQRIMVGHRPVGPSGSGRGQRHGMRAESPCGSGGCWEPCAVAAVLSGVNNCTVCSSSVAAGWQRCGVVASFLRLAVRGAAHPSSPALLAHVCVCVGCVWV